MADRYVCGASNGEVSLFSASTRADRAPMRAHEWGYSLGRRSVRRVARKARECEIEVVCVGRAEADRVAGLLDADTAMGEPGRVWVSGWSQRATAVRIEQSEEAGEVVVLAVTLALLDGSWSRDTVTSFAPSSFATGSEFLDLPYDLPYDLAAPAPGSTVTVGSMAPVSVGIRVYGPAIKPYVSIGGNRYAVDADVPPGGILTLDGRDLTAVVTDVDGNATDVIDRARRGREGGGEYAFERLPPGEHEVRWDGSFGFDVIAHEERGMPTCAR